MTDIQGSTYFPPVSAAASDGLVYFGGRLTPDWLIDAYMHGIFPWPFGHGDSLMAWWSPDPRAVLELEALHVPRRLERTMRSGQFTVDCDTDFAGVIEGCATAQDRVGNTWLGDDMIAAYRRMFDLNFAHSVEVRHEGRLVGGTYGLAIGGLFAAESMFYTVRDASKVALVTLVRHLRARGYALMDIQQLTPHTAQFGARNIRRSEYLRRLAAALRVKATFGKSLEGNTG